MYKGKKTREYGYVKGKHVVNKGSRSLSHMKESCYQSCVNG